MGLRDILVFCVVFGALPFVLIRPWVGVLLWVWLSVMNPHRLTWGAAYNFRFAMWVAAVTLVGLVVSREPIRWKGGGAAVVLLLFVAWTCFTTLFALVPFAAQPMLERTLKIQLFTFVALLTLYTRKHVVALVWILALSIGYYGVKGGVFTIATGGTSRVWGPPDSFIGDNNALAVAVLMSIPLWMYLYRIHRATWLRVAIACAAVLSAVSALGSQSRGALLALLATSFFLWKRTRGKLISGAAFVVIGVTLISFMPDSWTARMRTIDPETGVRESSSQGRLDAWAMITNLALDRPIVGGGFAPYSPQVWERYFPNYRKAYSAHSIYFAVLAEHGFVGLGLFLLLWLLTWNLARRLAIDTAGRKDEDWAHSLAVMSQASLVAYLVGGAFLDLAYWDGPYYVLAALGVARYALMAERNARGAVVPNRDVIGSGSNPIVEARDERSR